MKALYFLNFAAFLRTQIFMLPILLLFYQAHGLTVADFFFFQGIFSLTGLIMEIPSGYIADRYSRKFILIGSYCLYLLRLLLLLFMPYYWGILIAEIFFGASKAFFNGTSDSYIYDLLKQQGKSREMLENYAHLNFFMSAGTTFAALVGAWLYQQEGFIFILTIEITLNIISILLLCYLPNIKPVQIPIESISEKYKATFQTIVKTLKEEQLSVYILFAGLLFAVTTLFVWSFQPLMELFSFPVYLFGIVYFINHAFRMVASACSCKILNKISLVSFGVISYLFFFLSFVVLIIILFHPNFNTGFIACVLMCAAIGGQLIFSIGNVARLHQIATPELRATVSSVNTMIARLLSSLCLISLKFLLSKIAWNIIDFQIVFLIFGSLFLVGGGGLLYRMRLKCTV